VTIQVVDASGAAFEVADAAEALSIVDKGGRIVGGDRVPVVNPRGRPGTIDPTELATARAGGYRPVTEGRRQELLSAIRQRRMHEQETGLGGMVHTGLEQLNFISDLGQGVAERLTDNPNAQLALTMGIQGLTPTGLAAQAFGQHRQIVRGEVQGPEEQLARRRARSEGNPATGELARGLGIAGASMGVGGVLGGGGMGLGGALARTSLGRALPAGLLRTGAALAGEGAIEGVAHGINEEARRNQFLGQQLEAEDVIANILTHGATGMVAGPIAGGVAHAAGALTRRLMPSSMEWLANRMAVAHTQARKRFIKDLMRREALDDVGVFGLGLHRLNGTTQIIQDSPEETWRAAQAFLRDGAGPNLGRAFAEAGNPTVDPRRLRSVIQDVVNQHDGPFQQQLWKRLRRIADPMNERILGAEVGALDDPDAWIRLFRPRERIGSQFSLDPISASELHRVRQSLDAQYFIGDSPKARAPNEMPPIMNAMREIREGLDSVLKDTVEEAGSANIRDAHRAYELGSRLRAISFDAAAGDAIASGGMGAALQLFRGSVPRVVAAMTGMQFGVVGAIGFMLATGAVQRYYRTSGRRHLARGMIRAARGMREIGVGSDLFRATDDAVRRTLRAGAQVGASQKSRKPRTNVADYDERAQAAARGDHPHSAAASEYARRAPAEQAALLTAAWRRRVEAPVLRLPGGALPPGSTTLRVASGGDLVSDFEKAAWLRYQEAVENPLSAVEDLENGVLTPEAVDAIRDVYPAFYQALTTRVQAELLERDEPPPYSTRLQLAILFPDLDVDPTLTQESVARWQQPYREQAAAQAGAQAPQPQAPRGSPRMAESMMSDTQRLEN
jgi:hypothetical protein